MSFRPKVNECITINKEKYSFTEHPSAPKMVFGQAGRRATVYQLKAEDNSLYALKVFTKVWRDPRNAVSARILRHFALLSSLQVCDLEVFAPQTRTGLIKAYPDLEYVVMIKWMNGLPSISVLLPLIPKGMQGKGSLNEACSPGLFCH